MKRNIIISAIIGTFATYLPFWQWDGARPAGAMALSMLGYAIKKNLAAVSDAANAYDAERQELLEKYAAKGEDGKFLVENGQYSIEDKEGFAKDLDELLAIETEVGINTVSEEEIEKCDDPRYDALTVADLETLEIMTE